MKTEGKKHNVVRWIAYFDGEKKEWIAVTSVCIDPHCRNKKDEHHCDLKPKES